VDQQRDGHEVDGELQVRLPARARRALVQQDQERAARREQADQRPPRELLVRFADDARRVDEIEDGEQHCADGKTEQIQQNEDAPSEVGRDRGVGCWARRRFRALRVDGIDGGHGAEFYPIGLARFDPSALCGGTPFRGEYRRPPVGRDRSPMPMNL
jgi:hypothetical protein